MISFLRGKIIDKSEPGKFVIDVNGVGYEVDTSLTTFFLLENYPDDVSLYIHMVVREDALLLYGFKDQMERALFRGLIKVNGIGPKLAITILSSMQPEEFNKAIEKQDDGALAKIPGIGKKTAQRLVIEMKGSISKLSEGVFITLQDTNSTEYEAVQALIALGYKQNEAINAVKKVFNVQKSSEQLIKEALSLK